MPSTLSYPGVYVEEVPSGVRTIVGVATSITAFIGRSKRGPTNEPIRLGNVGDFEKKFGSLHYDCPMTYAVHQFFLNGGNDAIIVRVANSDDAAKAKNSVNGLPLRAKGEGDWGNQLRVRVTHETRTDPKNPDKQFFNLFVHDAATKTTETFRNVSVAKDDPRYVVTVLDEESQFVEFDDSQDLPGQRPDAHPAADLLGNLFGDGQNDNYTQLGEGSDGSAVEDKHILGERNPKTGIYALERADLFNLLCIPPLSRTQPASVDIFEKAAKYCSERRAFLLVDPSEDAVTVEAGEQAAQSLESMGEERKNAAMFFPWLKFPDPLKENRLQPFAPCGAVAGIIARTDAQRGVWKSPAGLEAAFVGARDFTFRMTDQENGRLNILGVNCLRNFPGVGNLVWGARTLHGADILTSEWKYLAVRRLALYLEESLYRGTKWVVFEPNDEPLWANIRLNVGAFMQNLFRQGAFQGRSPREAYFVRCGADTTNQNDINRGIVNIEIGFAPLKPAEFVILKFQQITGKIEV